MAAEIAVCIVSWMHEEKLMRILSDLPRTTSIRLGVCVNVQGSENIPLQFRRRILNSAKDYEFKDIYFTPDNRGTGRPRAEVTRKALKYGTPYLLFTDNDMIFPRRGIDTQLKFLKSQEGAEYGIVNLTHDCQFQHIVIRDGMPIYEPLDKTKKGVFQTGLIGSATMLMRRKVFQRCSIDPNYRLGVWDYDFCMSVLRAGWKIGTYVDKDLVAINDKRGSDKIYNATRYNARLISKSRSYFHSKWGFKANNKALKNL